MFQSSLVVYAKRLPHYCQIDDESSRGISRAGGKPFPAIALLLSCYYSLEET